MPCLDHHHAVRSGAEGSASNVVGSGSSTSLGRTTGRAVTLGHPRGPLYKVRSCNVVTGSAAAVLAVAEHSLMILV